MATTTDPRDPRVISRPVGEQLDAVADGLDVTLSMLTARLGEMIKTQQEANNYLAVMARTVSDDDTIGQGVGGVRTPELTGVMAKKAVLAAQPSTRVGPRSNRPYTAGIDYRVDAAGGALAAQTRTGVRSGVANWLTGRASYLADQYELHEGERLGQYTGAVYAANPSVHMDSQGRYHNVDTGRYVSADEAAMQVMSGEERAGIGSKLAVANTMARMGTAWEGGAGIGRSLAAALPEGALKFAGGAAVAVTAANTVWQRVQGQYDANRQFQEAYGGSNMDQLGDRGAQWVNRNITGRFSLLGGGNYDALFKGGMNMGLRGSDRQQYINTGADIMGTGVSSEQTKQIMDMSIQAGLGLTGLAKAIKEVNEAARDAGINARHAREMFIKNYEAGTELMFGSQNAKNFATLTTQGQLAQARPFQDITQTGMMQNTSVQMMRANQLGMNLGQYEVATAASPGGAIAGNEQLLKSFIDQFPNPAGGKSVRQLVAEFIQENGGSYTRQDQIALGEHLKANGWDEYYCHRILQRFNIDDGGQEKAPGYIGNLYTSESAGSIAIKSAQQARLDFAPKAVTGTGQNLIGSSGRLGSADAVANMRARALSTLGLDPTMGRTAGDLAQLYVNSVAGKNLSPSASANWDVLKGKQLSAGVENLIGRADELGLTKKSMVRVMTKDGPRVITLEQALRDFPDQVASSAMLVGGVSDEYIDQTIGSITGAPTGKITSNSKSINYGQTQEDFNKEQDKKDNADGDKNKQKVTLDLSPEAKRLLVPMLDQSYYSTSAPTSGAGP